MSSSIPSHCHLPFHTMHSSHSELLAPYCWPLNGLLSAPKCLTTQDATFWSKCSPLGLIYCMKSFLSQATLSLIQITLYAPYSTLYSHYAALKLPILSYLFL